MAAQIFANQAFGQLPDKINAPKVTPVIWDFRQFIALSS